MTKNAGWPKAVLFDLDGTLLDSAPDIAAATNELLKLNALPELTVEQVRKMIGNGVRKLVERAFAYHGITLDEAALNARQDQMMGVFGNHLTNATKPYDGVGELLDTLHNQGVKLAIVTNKPERFVYPILSHFGWDKFFPVVLGGDTLPTKKPDPQMLLTACEQLGVAPSDAVMVGDNAADIGAAKNASMKCIAIRGGYTKVPVEDLGATAIANGFTEVEELLQKLK